MIFPIADLELVVAESDKTRIDCSGSYVSFGSDEIKKIEIQPTRLLSAIDVTANHGILDWAYEAKIEIITAENDRIDFKEGSAVRVATLTQGRYTLDELAAEASSKMTAAGTQTYTVSVSTESNKFTISAPSAFSLLVESGANASRSAFWCMGFIDFKELNQVREPKDLVSASVYTGFRIKAVELTVTVTVTDQGGVAASTTADILVMTDTMDMLWSNDQMLRVHEADVMKYLPEGRASWKDKHRMAQTEILAWLDKEGYVDDFREKFGKHLIKDFSEMREWSVHKTLQLIFEAVSNETDDVFHEKAERYERKAKFYSERAVLRIDLDKSGTVEIGEDVETMSCLVVRR